MAPKLNIESAEGFVPVTRGRKSPAGNMISQANEQGRWSIRQASEVLGVSQSTLRTLLRSKKVKAPSEMARRGGLHVWLLTEEDMVELGEYFNAKQIISDELKRVYDHKVLDDIANRDEG